MEEEYAEYRCSACKKSIRSVVAQCKSCDKRFFHPGCTIKHRINDKNGELVQCGPFVKFALENQEIEEMKKGTVGSGNVERMDSTGASGVSVASRSRTDGGNIESREKKMLESSQMQNGSINNRLEKKVDRIFEIIKEMKEETVGKNIIRKIIEEAVEEKLDRIRMEIQKWKTRELEEIIAKTVAKEVQKITNSMQVTRMEPGINGGKSYSEAVKAEQEAVIIIKPRDEEEGKSSETTRKDIKSKINVSKLGVGITKMKKVTRGAVVIGCENRNQIEKLKEEVTKDLGDKYIIQSPKKKKQKIKITDVDKEDCEKEQDFWDKIIEQNGLRRDSTEGRIVHKSSNEKTKRTTIIAEVNDGTRGKLLELGTVKIGWKICRIQEYIGIVRCYKCCGFYHFARECTKKECCGNCAGQHATKECSNQEKKCINCEDKIKNFKIKNLKSNHSAYDKNCPCIKKEIEKRKSRIHSSL